jgi:hypothetical protein
MHHLSFSATWDACRASEINKTAEAEVNLAHDVYSSPRADNPCSTSAYVFFFLFKGYLPGKKNEKLNSFLILLSENGLNALVVALFFFKKEPKTVASEAATN